MIYSTSSHTSFVPQDEAIAELLDSDLMCELRFDQFAKEMASPWA